jgi:hypothetical protein
MTTHDEVPEGDDPGVIGPRPALTITEAAQAAGVDRRTIRHRLDNGDLPHANREDGGEGPWRIPVDDLLAVTRTVLSIPARTAQCRRRAPTPCAHPAQCAPGHRPRACPTPPAPAPDSDELAQWRERALVAEALATERERTITGLELALGPDPGPDHTLGEPAGMAELVSSDT